MVEPPLWLRTAARRLADTPAVWWPKVQRENAGRWYVRLLADEQREAWLLGWPVGEGIELHDHGDSAGAVCVVEGTLLETYVDGLGDTPGGCLRRRRLPVGALVAFGPGHIHDVV